MLSLWMRFLKLFQLNKFFSGKLMTAILATSLVLVGCGGGSSSTINEAAVLAGLGGVTPNTGTMTITVVNLATLQPIMNAYVVIDSTGIPQASNTQGVAVFTGLTAGPHDVHVFADGYAWRSVLQVNNAAFTMSLDAYPFVTAPIASITAPIANLGVNPYAQGYIQADLKVGNVSYFGTGNSTGTNDVFGNPNYTFSFSLDGWKGYRIPVGQSVTGTLMIEQVESNPNTKVNRVIDAVNAGSLTLTANAVGTAVPAPHILISLHASKPALKTLVTVTVVTSPTMIRNPYVSVTADRPNHGVFSSYGYLAAKNNFIPIGNTTLTGFDLANYANIQVTASSSDTYTYWKKMKFVSTGATTSFSALTTSLPRIIQGQVGSIISWVPPQGSYIAQSFAVLDNKGKIIWGIISPKKQNSVALPPVPTGIFKPLIVPGSTYQLGKKFVKNIVGYTYNQALATSPNPVMNTESLADGPAAQTVSWTR